ncbi:Bax inhibitor-1 family protein [Trifolium repens]|nr:Bax inhibitor-1 family protein [Trifolium repens]
MTTFNVETQNLETTDPSIGSNVTRAPRRNRSSVWNHFTPDPVLIGIAICDYCKAKLKSSNGTTSMAAHTKGCKSNPNNGANKRLATTSSSDVLPSWTNITCYLWRSWCYDFLCLYCLRH